MTMCVNALRVGLCGGGGVRVMETEVKGSYMLGVMVSISCQFDISVKREPLLRTSLYHFGLWRCL